MSNHGDDCYFFYYSTCSKGDGCPFRHCEAAMGNETVCNLWQEGRCFRTVCKFRHMEITKNRKEIPCYWEHQAAGCQKPHCAFFHERSRYIDGMLVPPDKSGSKNVEQPHEEPAPPPAAPLPTAANPQLRGVIKTEAQEPVPSPTHPPVVINPADDDEDEDDQYSEEGEDGKVGFSPRKLPRSDNALNFGVSTLEEIRLRKALKASMKRAVNPVQNADPSANREKENIQSFFRPVLHEERDESGRQRGSVSGRLGRKMPHNDAVYGDGVPMKRSLAQRLGRVVDEEEPSIPPQKAFKPMRERLGLSTASADPQPAPETASESKEAPEPIRIKTLEEIRQEKAAKSQPLSNHGPSGDVPEINNTKTTKGAKRGVKDHPANTVKTFSEILRAKRKRQEEEEEQQQAKGTEEKAPGKSQEPDPAGLGPGATNLGGVRVKTLEEIRREKAERVQARQNKSSSDSEEEKKKPPRLLLRTNKPAAQSSVTQEESADVTEKPAKRLAAAAPQADVANGNGVKVKTFEEIMREKRLRKQELEQAKGSAEAEPGQKETEEGTLKRKAPAAALASGVTTPPTKKSPVRKLIPLKSKAASPQNADASSGTRGVSVTSVLVKQCPSGAKEVPGRNNSKPGTAPAKKARVAPQNPTAEVPTADKTQNNVQKKSPEQTTNAKVRPKLNVKPSVMKPAVHVKPGQKRRGAGRSAVAAVKPLNSAPRAPEEPLQETACSDRRVFPSSSEEAQLSSAVPCSPCTLLDSGSSPLREELQTVPVSKPSASQETKPSVNVTTASEACTVPQSPVLTSPTQPRSRRTSVTAPRTASISASSAVDDFEDLMNEFTDDHLDGDDVDAEIGEDDLLQELSEMIDS